MKYAYFSLTLILLSCSAAAYAQSDDDAIEEAMADEVHVEETRDDHDALHPSATDGAPVDDQSNADAAEDSAIIPDAAPRDEEQSSFIGGPSNDTLDEEPPDFTDLDVRNKEITDICDAACTGAPSYDECVTVCTDQTYACFAECDTLPAQKNDCFVGCTHIAVDERDRQEQLALERRQQELQEPVYGRKFAFGMNAVGGMHNVPNFLVGAFFQRNTSHWQDHPKYFYGGEFVFRFDDKHDLLITLDYADYQTPNGWWLEKDKNATAAEWVHNDLRALAITIGWNGIVNLDKQKRAHFYGGIGLGVTLKMGDFNKAKVRLGCVNPNTDLSVYDSLSIDGPCPTGDSGTVLGDQAPDGSITAWEKEKIPAVLPSFVATAGFRYLIADTVSIAVEGGWKTVAFYGGLKVGFMVGKSNEKRQKEAARAAASAE